MKRRVRRREQPSPRTWRRSKAMRRKSHPELPAGWSAQRPVYKPVTKGFSRAGATRGADVRGVSTRDALTTQMTTYFTLNIHRRGKRIVLDEFAPGLDHIAHQLGE